MMTNKKANRTDDEMKALREQLKQIGTCFIHTSGSMGKVIDVRMADDGLALEAQTVYVYAPPRDRKDAKQVRERKTRCAILELARNVKEIISSEVFERHERSTQVLWDKLDAEAGRTRPEPKPDLEALSARVRELTDKVADLTMLVQSRDGVINELRSTVARLSQRPTNEDPWDPEKRRQNVVRRIV